MVKKCCTNLWKSLVCAGGVAAQFLPDGIAIGLEVADPRLKRDHSQGRSQYPLSSGDCHQVSFADHMLVLDVSPQPGCLCLLHAV